MIGDICPVCQKRIIPGYHHLIGAVLERTCYHCWKNNPDNGDKFERHRSTIGKKGGARL